MAQEQDEDNQFILRAEKRWTIRRLALFMKRMIQRLKKLYKISVNLKKQEVMPSSKYEQLVAESDLNALDKEYLNLIINGSVAAKEELAQDGYLALFYQMEYDYFSGKLLKQEFGNLLPIIEKAESLLGYDLLNARGEALLILLENAIAETPEEVTEYAQQAINILKRELQITANDQHNIYRKLALVFSHLANQDYADKFSYWTQSIESMKKSAALNPLKTNWCFYLKLLYLPVKNETGPMAAARDNEKRNFKQLTLSLSDRFITFPYILAIEYHQFRKHLEYNKPESSIFPETDYFYWLNLAKKVPLDALSSTLMVNEAGHFFQKEGVRLQRVDLLLLASEHYQKSIELCSYDAFPVLYMTGCLEGIAGIYAAQGNSESVAEFLNKAVLLYLEHLESVKANFSALIQYAEFLERCLDQGEKVKKASIAEIRELAKSALEEGKGFYASPGMLLARLALREKDDVSAIFFLKRELLLHELCIEQDFKKCINNPQFTSIKAFILDTLGFMKEIAEGYYLDSSINWGQLRLMTRDEVSAAWESRKIELKNRTHLII